jgi:hypothetical protein
MTIGIYNTVEVLMVNFNEQSPRDGKVMKLLVFPRGSTVLEEPWPPHT